jgi:tripartite-type tricarboxylate transporter receptor subunit TctC
MHTSSKSGISRRRFTSALLGAALAGLVGAKAWAQSPYPSRAVRLIVPYPAAGAADLLARTFGQALSEQLGQPVVIENRGGANGTIGSNVVAKAAPDGYTLLLDNITFHAINATLYKTLPFNTLKDFAPVGLVGWVDNVLVVNPSTPATSLKELIALARSMPSQLTYASSGAGSTSHLSGVMLNTAAGIDMLHVPYRGGAPAMTDVMGGVVTAYFAGLSTALSTIEAGRLRALAVAGVKRNAALPNVPTLAEAGLTGFNASNWYGLMVPTNTPADIVSRLNAEMVKLLQNSDVRAKMVAQGYEVTPSTPKEMGDYMQLETTRWAQVVKTSGASAD